MVSRRFAAAMLLAASFGISRAEIDLPVALYYVSPEGNDAWSGKLAEPSPDGTDGPFGTIEKARDTIRAERGGAPRAWTVLVREGTYVVEEPLTFGPEDSGTDEHPVTYAAYPGEHPVISGGRVIEGWRPAAGGFGPARGKLWMAEIPETRGCNPLFNLLYVDGVRRTRARGPNGVGVREGFYTASEPEAADDRYGTTSFKYAGESLENWPNLADIELDLILEYTWLNHILPVGAVDETSHRVTLASPAVYTVRGYRVENALHELDEPGEWCVNTVQRRVYYWPPGGTMEGAEAIAPTMVSVVRFLGDEAAGRFVRNIGFRGFTITHGDRSREYHSIRPQFCGDSLDGAVLLRGAERITVEGCTVVDTGAWGILLDLHAQDNRIVGNTICGAGAGGVLLLGYGVGTKDVNHGNEVSWNKVHHCGRIYYHSHGVAAWQSGDNRIEHNLIFDMPYCGICLLGVGSEYCQQFRGAKTPPYNMPDWPYWFRYDEIPDEDPLNPETVVKYRHARNNLLQYNVCYDLMKVVQDGGAYYNCSSGADNVVRRNLAKDIFSWGHNLAVYQDYESHAKVLEQNVLVDGGNTAGGFWAAHRGATPLGQFAFGVSEMLNDEHALLETMLGICDTFQYAGAMDRPPRSVAWRAIRPPRKAAPGVTFACVFDDYDVGDLVGQHDWEPFGPRAGIRIDDGVVTPKHEPGLVATTSAIDCWAAVWHGVLLDSEQDLVVELDACIPEGASVKAFFELYFNRYGIHQEHAFGPAIIGGAQDGLKNTIGLRADSGGPRSLSETKLTPGHWYRLRLRVPAGGQSGTLSLKNLTAGDEEYSPLRFADDAETVDLSSGDAWSPEVPSLTMLVLRLGADAQVAGIRLCNPPKEEES